MLLTTYRPHIRHARHSNGVPLSLLNEVFPEFFTVRPAARRSDQANAHQTIPTTQARFDVVEKVDRYEAYVDLPGVNKQDIEVEIEGARVSVKAEARIVHGNADNSAPSGEQNADENAKQAPKDGERVLYAERRATVWSRSFELPAEVAEERAEAHYENGVLKLVLPKKEVVQAKRVQVQ